MDEMGFFVSQNLHHYSIRNIFYAPMSFFDTTVRSSRRGLQHITDTAFSPWEEYSACLEKTSKVRVRPVSEMFVSIPRCRHR